MPLTPGTSMGPYEIVAPIGAGGMGEVYRARDPRLQRDVAVKVSAEKFTERFEREARAVASLNHSNICHLYDVGPDYLVMELIEGATLAERLNQGPIPLDEALEIAGQIAAALEAAHEKGVVHRDLKPGNIKITPDGTVKVLDFGLAKTGTGPATASSQDSPTISMAATQAGVILGTAGYMAPEQARGKQVDKRADIWAFGVVLYEIVTGKRLFGGDNVTDTLAAVVTKEPDWDQVPARVRPLLRRCLQKDPKKRLRDIGDALPLLEDTRVDAPAVAAPKRSTTPWIVAGAALAGIAALGFVHFREQPPAPPQPVRFQIETGQLSTGNNFYMPISPNGRMLAYTAFGPDGKRKLWIREMETLESRELQGTEDAVSPFWSPDSRYLAFSVGNAIKKIEASGGSPPQTLTAVTAPPGSGSWNSDGVIVFGGRGSGPLRKVPAAGGSAVDVTALGNNEAFHTFPVFLPDGHHFLYLRSSSSADVQGVYIGSIDAKPVEQPSKRLMPSQYGVVYTPPLGSGAGHVLFLRENTLMAQAFDAAKLELTGEAVPIAERVGRAGSGGWFTASANGVLAYRVGGVTGTFQLTWYDSKGAVIETLPNPAAYNQLALSPDGKKLASFQTSGQQDLWVLDLARGVPTRLTFDAGVDEYPVWSPDGSKIAFTSNRNGSLDLYVKASNGATEEQLLLKSAEAKAPTSWSSDGRFLLYMVSDPKQKLDIAVLPMESAAGGKPVTLLQTPFSESNAAFSPDGKWIAYVSDESGRQEVYVRPFNAAGPSLGEGKWQVSRDGANGSVPIWRGDGKELFFVGLNNTLLSVDVSLSPSFSPGIPQRRMTAPAGTSGGAIAKDGKRVLLAVPAGQDQTQPITVLLNWQSRLSK